MQLFKKKTTESSIVQHSSLYSNSQETCVQEPPTNS